MPVDVDKLNGNRPTPTPTPPKPYPGTPNHQPDSNLTPINDASTGFSTALRETAHRHRNQLEQFRRTKHSIARQVASAYAAEIKSFDSDVAAALVDELGGTANASNPFSFDLSDIWEPLPNQLAGYQPKYLNGDSPN